MACYCWLLSELLAGPTMAGSATGNELVLPLFMLSSRAAKPPVPSVSSTLSATTFHLLLEIMLLAACRI